MVDELQGVRQQLEHLQENQPKSVKDNLMDRVAHLQEKITDLSERLLAVKDHLVETAAQAVNAFKEKGKAEMCKVLQKGISGVKSMLSDYRECLVDVIWIMKKQQTKYTVRGKLILPSHGKEFFPCTVSKIFLTQ